MNSEILEVISVRNKFGIKADRCAQIMLEIIKDLTKLTDENALGYLKLRLDNLIFIAYSMAEPNSKTGSLGVTKEVINFLSSMKEENIDRALFAITDLAGLVDFSKMKEVDLKDFTQKDIVDKIMHGAAIGSEIDKHLRVFTQKLEVLLQKKKNFGELH